MKASLKTHKKIFVTAGAVLILLISLVLLAYFVLGSQMNLIRSSMNSTMLTFENKYKRAESLSRISGIIDEETTQGAAYLAETVFREVEDVQTALDILQRGYYDCWLIDSAGKVYTAAGSPSLSISEDDYARLLNEGTLTTETDGGIRYYECIEEPQGTLISCYKKPVNLGTDSLMTGLSDYFNYFTAPVSNGIIDSATDAALIGSKAPGRLKPSETKANNTVLNRNEDYNYGFADLCIGKAYCITYETDEYVYGLYYSEKDILKDVFNEMKTPAVLLAGTFAVILIFFFSLWKNSDEKNKKWVRVFRTNTWFEESQVRHLACFVIFGMIVTLLFNVHFMKFSSYSLQNALTTRNLDMLAKNIEACEKDRKVLSGIAEDYNQSIADRLSDLMVTDRDICSHAFLKKMSEKCFVTEISVYDREGMLEASSGEYFGYSLTENENDPEYAVRRILTDDEERVFIDYDDESGRFLLAHRRKDTPGIICIKYENPLFTEMLKHYSKDEAIKNTDFGNATTFFIKLEDNNSIYVIEPHSTQITATQIHLPEGIEQDSYSGIAKIAGTESYVNTKNSGGIVVISAIDCKLLDGTLTSSVLILVALFILYMILLFCGCMCRPEKVEDTETDNMSCEETAVTYRNRDSVFADICFRRMIKYECVVLAVGYCFMMFKPVIGDQTILRFVFEGNWDKGINLFSINASIIVAAVILVMLFILKKILAFAGKSIGAKGMTICSIAASVVSFLALFFVLLHTLYQLGVNTTALLASAGIAGLVIGIAAKDIFGDLIAGLFLIFEGNIRVGDFIKYKDFRGEVTEIGARTTVIKRYNNKLIVNNSDLKQYYRLSDEPGAAWVEIAVDVNEDIEKIRTLIADSAQWYQSRIPTLLAGPWFLNVSKIDSACMTICLCGSCIEERSGSTRRKLLVYTRELFIENGITLGVNSMKIELRQNDTSEEM